LIRDLDPELIQHGEAIAWRPLGDDPEDAPWREAWEAWANVGSLTYGDAYHLHRHACEPHEWDNRTVDEQRAWLTRDGIVVLVERDGSDCFICGGDKLIEGDPCSNCAGTGTWNDGYELRRLENLDEIDLVTVVEPIAYSGCPRKACRSGQKWSPREGRCFGCDFELGDRVIAKDGELIAKVEST